MNTVLINSSLRTFAFAGRIIYRIELHASIYILSIVLKRSVTISSEVGVFGLYCRQERNTAGLDHIIAAMNIFFNTFAVNCRKRICKIGEEILPTVLYIWTQYRPKDSLKESIIELFLLQVHIHHPRGATSQEKGTIKSSLYVIAQIIVLTF